MSDIVIARIAEQEFGVPVAQIRDVLRRRQLTPVPLAPRGIAGLLNLRGRIVTAIDLRIRLGLPPRTAHGESTFIVVESGSDLYALIADSVGDVLTLDEREREAVPPALDPRWRDVACGIYPTDSGLIVLFDIARLVDLVSPLRAAS